MHRHLIGFVANRLMDTSIDDKPSVDLNTGRIGLWACGPSVPSFLVRAAVGTEMLAGVKVKSGGVIDGHGT